MHVQSKTYSHIDANACQLHLFHVHFCSGIFLANTTKRQTIHSTLCFMRVSWARALFVNDLAMQLTHEISQAALFSGVAVTGVAVMEVAVVLWAFVCFACAPPDLNAVKRSDHQCKDTHTVTECKCSKNCFQTHAAFACFCLFHRLMSKQTFLISSVKQITPNLILWNL